MTLPADKVTDLEQRLALELKRGVVALAVLSALREPGYGNSLQQRLVDRGLDVDQGTLHPLLRRLDEQRLLESDWNVEGARPRKYYRLSVDGERVLASMRGQWADLVRVVDGLLESSEGEPS